MKVILAGAGAFGAKHLEAMSKIDGIEVLSLVSRDPLSTAEVAKKWKIPHCTMDLAQALAQPGVEAALLCSPILVIVPCPPCVTWLLYRV